MSHIPLIARAQSWPDRTAMRSESHGFTYSDLLNRSAEIARALCEEKKDLQEERVAFLIPAGFDYAAVQWGIWQAGGIAVPLSHTAAEPELDHVLSDSQVGRLITTGDLAARLEPLAGRLRLPLQILEEMASDRSSPLPDFSLSRRAMILYTSGTTSKPKGVVTTHSNIEAQIRALIEAWEWQSTDSIPLFLPLHHIHGIINVLSCALWSGAVIEPFTGFDVDAILKRVAEGAYTLFMAVPTVYVKLIQALEAIAVGERGPIIHGFAQMRLMVSGSAALPVSVHEKWTELTGQRLLERYGMTEIGMALSNPYRGERRAGAVGQPLPGVEVRLHRVDSDGLSTEGEPGEIQVKGPGVFLEYWNRPEAMAESFQEEWFKTGDVAAYENGYYRIMGRQSVDIIKSGGYKISALEIEASLLDHPAIAECAVVGIPDDTWGEVVAVAIVLRPGAELTLEGLRIWSQDRLSTYKIPKALRVSERLPRNALGKVLKPEVQKLFA